VKEVVQRTAVVSHKAASAEKQRNYWEFISGSIIHRGRRVKGGKSKRE